MNDEINKDLGIVTAYAYAVSKGYTGTEDEFAALMADYAEVGERAEAAASAAAASATAASGSASDSAASATAAAGSSTAASTAAGNASQAAQTATTKASEAAQSATQAAGSATTASTKATEAAQSATAAAGSATAAESAKTAAQTAQTAAETAQTAAETAQGAAEDAAESVSASAAQIAQNTADISDVKNALGACIITDTASGAIATFTDGSDGVPMESVTVAMEPIQDLHGQDAPYPGGSTKNLFNNTAASGTASGVTFTVKPDFTVVVNGTASDSSNAVYALGTITLEPGDYIISSGIVSSDIYFQIVATGISGINTEGVDNYGFTISTTVTATGRIVARSGKTANNVTIYPMIRKSTEPSGYIPYSNICPISGRSAVGVWRSGVNVWDEEWEVGSISDTNGQNIGTATCIRSTNYIPVQAETQYYFCCDGWGTNNNVRTRFYDADKNYIGYAQKNGTSVNKNTAFVTPTNCAFMRFSSPDSYGTTYNHDISINYPSTDHEYHPHDIQTITLQLGQTVYGGSLEIINGELESTKAIVTYDGTTKTVKSVAQSSASGNYYAIADLPSRSTYTDTENLGTSVSDMLVEGGTPTAQGKFSIIANGTQIVFVLPDQTITTVAAFNAYLAEHPITVCYRLAQPVTVQLTAQQLTTLLGTNNVWSDGGNVSVEYVADTKAYIAKVIAAALA